MYSTFKATDDIPRVRTLTQDRSNTMQSWDLLLHIAICLEQSRRLHFFKIRSYRLFDHIRPCQDHFIYFWRRFFTLLLMWVSFKALGWAAGQNICLQTMCSWEFLGRPRCPESWVRCFSFESNTAVMSRAVIDFMPITQMVSGAVGFNLLENVFESRLHARPHSIWNPKNEFCLCSWFPAWSVMLNYIVGML